MNGLGAGGAQGPGGMQGAGGAGGVASGFPAPAGYTAELSYIHAMVEELSRQLSDNKRVLDDVVTGVGRVRTRAQTQQIGNEELITGASDELQGQQKNLDATISILTEALDAAKYGKEANAQLLNLYAAALASMLKQFHEYKQKHVADVSAWHRSYRHQLAEARAENCRLRDQVWQMQEAAGRANANLRAFRAAYDENPERWERRVADKAARQELRFWKRMAMPALSDETNLLADSALGGAHNKADQAESRGGYWSDDDDLVDGAEKVRLREVERKVAEEQQAQAQQEQQQQEQQQRAIRYQQQAQQQQQQEQEFQEMQALQYYQQQQRQFEQQASTVAAATGATVLPPPSSSSPPLASARSTTGGLGESLNGLRIRDDDTASEIGSVIFGSDAPKENRLDELDGLDNIDDDDDIDLESELSIYPPAVPDAPSSAPAPASIGLMERAVAALGRSSREEEEAKAVEEAVDAALEEAVEESADEDGKDDEEGKDAKEKEQEEETDPAALERPGSAASSDSSSSDGSTGSMESSGSDEL